MTHKGTRIDRGALAQCLPKPPRSELIIHGEDSYATMKIASCRPMPNLWRRFWYWILLGWTWRKRS